MFINLVEFPPVTTGRDQEFREWFDWSNRIFARFPGFISRRLLKAREETGGYWAIVEHESEASFMAMHTSPERAEAWAKVESLLVGRPIPRFLDVVVGGAAVAV